MATRTFSHPNLQACLYCRSKHLKCNAQKPTCDRCKVNQQECIYVQSRRGYVGGRRKRTDALVHNSHIDSNDMAQEVSSTDSTKSLPRALSTDRDFDDYHLIEAYYRWIHPAHPFVIPYKLYKQNPDILPSYLRTVMAFAASHMTRSPGLHHDEAYAVLDSGLSADVFKVQAYLLLTVTSYARCDRPQGDRALRQAVHMALEIGLNSESFNQDADDILRESWRRTWWELTSITSLISVLTPTTLRLEFPANRRLPCSNEQYDSLYAGDTNTFEEMQDRLFSHDDIKYSSFAYRIEAASILIDVLNFLEYEQASMQEKSVKRLTASIKSFSLSLPKEQSENRGETEMLTCALMTINLASILLHVPRTKLSIIRQFPTICATSRQPMANGGDENAHEDAALNAADAVTELLIHRSTSSMRTITPCFSCALAFAVTTQLSAYCLGQNNDQSRSSREYIQVSLSALDCMGENWPVARAVKRQLADFAREILGKRKRSVMEEPSPVAISDSNGFPLILAAPLENDMWLQDFINDSAGLTNDPANLAFTTP